MVIGFGPRYWMIDPAKLFFYFKFHHHKYKVVLHKLYESDFKQVNIERGSTYSLS